VALATVRECAVAVVVAAVAVTAAAVVAATMLIAAVMSVEEAIEDSHVPDSLFQGS
jgi:hypothetical protein